MTVRTARNLLRCVSLRRAWNLLRVFASFQLSARSGRSIVWGLPYTLTVEPTNRCNLSCPECPSGNGEMVRPLGSMPLPFFERIIDELRGETFYLQLFFQGEPFINKQLVAMVETARKRRMYTAISTNAHFLTRSASEALLDAGLDRLIVSIDGMSEETYQEYRVGGTLARVVEALGTLREARNGHPHGARMEVVLQFLVTRQNEGEIPALRALAREHGASVALKTIQVYSLESAERFLPADEKYRRYTIENGQLRPKSALANRCVRLWERSVITWDGTIVPCCFDKNAEYPLGSLADGSFTDAWKAPAYESFRARILSDRRGVPMCTNCTEGLKVYR
ncbi:MAG: SPASM domain-containing protein [Ignavibacteria bacterium]|nr:SPASM domain-containing protein [Ignavibacteria bacterium]